MDITGMIAIGNGEKCPYCDKIMEEDTDTVKHLLDHHAEQVMRACFPGSQNVK